MTHKIIHWSVQLLILAHLFGRFTINLAAATQLGAGPTNISNDKTNPQHEVAISVDPTNADRRVIVAMSKEGQKNKIRSYHTNNGGRSWYSEEVPRPEGEQFEKAQPWSDPSVAHDHEGRVYVAYNLREGARQAECKPPGGGEKRGCYDAIVVARYREDDADRAPYYESVTVSEWADTDVDKPFLEVDDNLASPGAGNIYVAWWRDFPNDDEGLYLAKSTDRGAHWTTQLISKTGFAVDLGIGPGGEVYVVWKGGTNIYFEDCGVEAANCGSDEPDSRVAVIADFLDNPPPAVGRRDKVLALPSIDVDRSDGPNRGRIWVAFADYLLVQHIEMIDIYITWSDDFGGSWNQPVKINLDDSLTSQFHPWLDVDDVDGSVGVVYYSTEADPVNNKIVHVQYAEFIAGAPSDQRNWTNWRITNSGSNVDNSRCGACFREYIGLHKQSHWAYLAWTSLHTGEPEVFHVKVLGE